jgi:glycosyltransferase involved in cell wall biosynthesis
VSISVLHVAETVTGGISSYFEEMLPTQTKELGQQSVKVLVPKSQLGQCRGIQSDSLCTYYDPAFRPLRLLTLAWAFYWLLRAFQPSVVHAHSSLAGVVVRVCCLFLWRRPCVVYCAHGWAWDRESPAWLRMMVIWAERLMSHLADAIVCISQHDHRTAQRVGIPSAKLVTIVNGINEDAPTSGQAEPPERRKFLFVGRFDRQKGVDIFLKAMSLMGAKADAYAIGSVVLDDGVSYCWPENVKATGWVQRERVCAYMACVDALVVPSRWEGFGLVALEAMRQGRPVLAARVGGLQDLVEDGVTGFLFDPNSPTALKDALERALSADLVAMGLAAKERFCRSYTAEVMNSELLGLYVALVDSSTRHTN